MEQSPENGNIFDTKYQDWTPQDLVLPEGITKDQLGRATELVFAWKQSGEPYGVPLVLEIFEVLGSCLAGQHPN